MLLNVPAKGNLHQEGFNKHVLEDGRTCLIWAKGYFFDSTGRMRYGEEIVDWLAMQLAGVKELPVLVPEMNGCFSVIVVWPEVNVVEVGIDRFGTIPIYYHTGDDNLIVSDDFWRIADRLSGREYDPDAVLSMVFLGYVTGYRTLLKDITELRQASMHRFSFAADVPELTSQRYWMLSYRTSPQRQPKVWREELARTLDAVFARHAQAVLDRGWEVHIPLSGGKDSRLLAGILNRNGAPVQAFSYGPAGNEETHYASQVANALSIPFRSVRVDEPSFLKPSFIQTMTRRVGMRARFTAGLGAQLSLSAGPQTDDETDVYVPGHVGDTLTSGDLSRGEFLVRSEAQAVQHLINGYSLLIPGEIGAALFPRAWTPASTRRVILTGWHFDALNPLSSLYRWHHQNANRRKYLTELRTYERFGHWMLPYYDYDLFEFFTRVPPELLYRQRLYVDTLIHRIFVDDLSVLSRIPIAYKGNLQVPSLSRRDRAAMSTLPPLLSDWILRRATNSKRREHLRTVGMRSSKPSGPDPLDHWWCDYPGFRESVIDSFRDWDGMKGIVDASALIGILQEPLPRLFIQFAVPGLLTLRYFQQIVEDEL
ncbi:MAG: asparagine synthase-related protein [bacterium]